MNIWLLCNRKLRLMPSYYPENRLFICTQTKFIYYGKITNFSFYEWFIKNAANLLRLRLISAPGISARDISARTFNHRDFSSWGNFGRRRFRHGYTSVPWTFQHSFRIFWKMDILAHIHFGTMQSNIDISAQTFWPGCPCAETSMCQNILVPEMSQCHNLPMQKSPWSRKNTHADMFLCWKVLMLKSPCDKTSGAEISPSP